MNSMARATMTLAAVALSGAVPSSALIPGCGFEQSGGRQGLHAGLTSFSAYVADDFPVPAGGAPVTSVEVRASLIRGTVGDFGAGTVDAVTVDIFEDASGTPGALVFSQSFPGPIGVGPGVTPLRLTLTDCPFLVEGTYWLSVHALHNADGFFFVADAGNSFGGEFQFFNNCAPPAPNQWRASSLCYSLPAGRGLEMRVDFGKPDADDDGLCDAGDRVSFSTASTHFVPGSGNLFRQNVYDVAMEGASIASLAGFLPFTSNIDALDVQENGDILFSVKPNTVVAGFGQLLENSVYRWDGASISLELNPGTIGVPLATLGALDRLADGSYAISVDSSQRIGTTYLRPWQVYRLSLGGVLTLMKDFGPHGFTGVDGVDVLPDGRIAASSTTDGFTFNPGFYRIWNQNVYIWNPMTGSLLLSFDAAIRRIRDLDGFSLSVAE